MGAIKTFEEFINENLDVKSFKNFFNYRDGGTVDSQKIIDTLSLLDYFGPFDSASIRKWMFDTYKVSFVCVDNPNGGYDYFFTTLRPNKLTKTRGEERYDKSKEVCYIVSEDSYKKEDDMFMENLLEGLEWLIEIVYNPDNPDFEHGITEEPKDYTYYQKQVKEALKSKRFERFINETWGI